MPKEKVFKNHWLEDPEFKLWLLPDKTSKNNAMCKVCKASIKGGKSELLKHAATAKHIKNIKAFQTNKNLINMFDDEQHNEQNTHMKCVKTAEIKLAAFFAANNIAFQVIGDLEPILKDIFPDSKIAQNICLKRTKCTEIIKNVLCKKETDELVTHLRKNVFSILLDESTDIGDSKLLALLVRYIKNTKVETRLLELIELDANDLGATKLYTTFKLTMEKYDIPLNNIIGMASDGASVMIGKNHSFFKLLHDDIPHVILLRCICHSAALVASKACLSLPRSPEDLMRNIYSYISGSAKRCKQLQEIQEYFQVEKHKILKLATTRWLSRYDCVIRILNNWTVLEHYFLIASQEDSLKTADLILNELRNLYTKAYFKFLKYILNMFNRFNALFQSRQPLIQILYSEYMSLLYQFCKNYIDSTVTQKDLSVVNLRHPNHFLPLEKIFVGPECLELVNEMPKEGKTSFLLTCQKFYIEAAVDLQNRIPDPILKDMRFLQFSTALNLSEHERDINFNNICDKYNDIICVDKTEIAIEWRMLPTAFNENERNKLQQLPIDEMWIEIGNKKRYDDTFAFQNLFEIAKIVLLMPHSNAEAERIFSIVTDTKCKKRNRLGETALNALCTFRSSLQASQIKVENYKITSDHLKLHNTNMYSFKTPKDN